ncbi:MAG: dihydrolipoyl dehydrogenase [Bacteroidales bacterium]|nr:dihydrolipoyl dehydrogenase [Bacteroidales bacterium]
MRIIIIGAGPGGYETALLAAKRGVEVVLIESGHVGGTCLNEGCIPTKSFCRNAEVLDTLKEASVFGVSDLSYTFDFSAVRDRKNAVVEQLRGGVESLLSNKLITLVRGKASFKDEHTVTVTPDVSGIAASSDVAVSDDTTRSSADVSGTDVMLQPVDYTADYIIIATGSTSASLPIPGADLPGVITSKEILDIEEVPQRLCIIGGGVIGLEFASIFNSFGSEVTVIEYCKDILPRFDTDLAKRLKQSLGKRGIEIFTQSQVLSIASDCEAVQEFAEHGISLAAAGQLAVTFSRKGKDETVVADKVLMAVGRRPAVSSLNLSDIGIEYSPKGIVVNDSMQTNIPHIYAVGDINGKMMLAHAATFQGIVALDHIMGLTDDIDLSVMPAAVFTSPEAATVGMTEDECKDKGIPVKCLKSFFRANGKAVTMGETDGFCKIVVDQSGRILGCHMFGPHSSDIIQEITALINSKATVDDLRNIIHTHPTLTEVLQSAVHQ